MLNISLNSSQQIQLKEALLFLHVEELKSIAKKFGLADKGKKGEVIARIMHFIETGEVRKEIKMPQISCVKRGVKNNLHPDTLMLKGAYKNDLATRLFFKKLIGDYFHFTAFGQDWLNERWLSGNPPTYQEYADMWVEEYARRKQHGSKPKEEWAYINFLQKANKENPNASREELLAAWEQERLKRQQIALDLLKFV
jgi:hypothetical protein